VEIEGDVGARAMRDELDRAFAAADRVFEHNFTTQQTLHLPLELDSFC
jgi:hypothetical protein